MGYDGICYTSDARPIPGAGLLSPPPMTPLPPRPIPGAGPQFLDVLDKGGYLFTMESLVTRAGKEVGTRGGGHSGGREPSGACLAHPSPHSSL